MNLQPLVAVAFLRLFAVFFEGVVFSLSARFGFAPAGLDPAFAFHSMEDGIEHAIGFELRERRTFEWGLLQSDLWARRRKVRRAVQSAPQSPFDRHAHPRSRSILVDGLPTDIRMIGS